MLPERSREGATEFPEVAVIESGRINLDDLRNCGIAVTNIQQIAGEENRWLDQLPPDFFDLILVDEGIITRLKAGKE